VTQNPLRSSGGLGRAEKIKQMRPGDGAMLAGPKDGPEVQGSWARKPGIKLVGMTLIGR